MFVEGIELLRDDGCVDLGMWILLGIGVLRLCDVC